MSDLDLLAQYARDNRQEAFSALLDRHLKLVYSAALRQVRSPELAQEVAQSVFADLACSAGKLEPKTVLTAWLYQVTRRTAIDVVRRESRRQLREKLAFDMTTLSSSPSEWTAIEPLLDEAMESLDPPDRTAILLRYFEDKSLREVGETLGTSEDAAQKRVSRALEQLREFFSKRGQTVAIAGLAAVISANAIQSAPVGLQTTILSTVNKATLGTVAITKAITMTTLQKAVIGATLAAAMGTGLYEARRAAALQEQVQTLKQSPPVVKQNDEAPAELAALRAENEKLRREAADVVRLRGEVVRLRDNAPHSGDSTSLAAKSWLARVNQLKDKLQQTPQARIPEFKYLTEQDWLAAAQGDLNTDEDYRKAFSGLRNAAESAFMSTALNPAVRQYEQANNGQFPTEIFQLQPYFDPPADDSILQRWQVAPASTVPSVGVGSTIITQVAAVDADYDSRYAIGPNGFGSSGSQDWDPASNPGYILKPVMQAYAAANNGLEPTDPSQLVPYATTPDQQAALQKVLGQRGPK